MDITVETITPDSALAMLKGTTFNQRGISQKHVDKLARDMGAGAWVLNGDPIRIDTEDNVIDGQHRLKACIKAGTPIQTVVCRNVDHSVVPLIDTEGRSRTAGDVFKMDGLKYSKTKASTARWLFAVERRDFSQKFKPSVAELRAVLDRWPTIHDAAKYAQGRRWSFIHSSAQLVALVAVGRLSDPDGMMAFTESLRTGESLDPGSPVLAYRRWMERRFVTTSGSVRLGPRMTWRNLCRVWNAYANNETLQRFNMPRIDIPPVGWDPKWYIDEG